MRAGMSAAEAYEILAAENAKGMWDPDVFGAFEALYRRGLLETR